VHETKTRVVDHSNSHSCILKFSTIFWEFSQLFLPPDSLKPIFLNLEINFKIQILIPFFYTGPLAIWPISLRRPTWPVPPFPLSSSPCRSSSLLPFAHCRDVPATAHLHALEQTRRMSPSLTRSPPPPLLNSVAFPPLLHSGNGTIEGAHYHHCLPFPATSASLRSL
jgi:hypothetical protein